MFGRYALKVCIATIVLWWPGAAATASGRYERAVDRTLPVKAGQTIRVDTRHGDVTIISEKIAEVKVHADVRILADNEKEAREYGEAIEVRIGEGAGSIDIQTIYPERGWLSKLTRNISFSVDYRITVPESAPLSILNQFGDVSVAGSRGGSTIDMAHGTLVFRSGAGVQRLENKFGRLEVAGNAGDIFAVNANGDIVVDGVTGGVDAENRFGAVDVTNTGKQVAIRNGNGEVRVTTSGAWVTVTNSFGAVTLSDVKGNARVDNGNGDVNARGIAGTADLNTSFASIEASSIQGRVTAGNANGSIRLVDIQNGAEAEGSFGKIEITNAAGPVRVVSNNGDVLVRGAGGDVFVKTSFGGVDVSGIKGSLTVENSNGAVTASDIRGPAGVRTSFSPVELRGVAGAIDVSNSNGSIDVDGSVPAGSTCRDILLKTSFAPIRVSLTAPDFTVDARTSFGRIRSDFPMSVRGSLNSDDVAGTIGKGTCRLLLSNSNGDIDIEEDVSKAGR